MTKNKILLFSGIVGIIYVGRFLLKPEYQGDGLGEIANGMPYIFGGFILLPLIFGILSFALSKERRFMQALSSFGISFAVIVGLMLLAGAWKNMQREKLCPPTEVEFLPADSPERKNPQN
jgi:hypothetical protein